MLKTILVPLDGSPFAERALPLAVALVQQCGAHLVLLRVAETSADLGDVQTENEDDNNSVDKYLRRLVTRLSDPRGATPVDAARLHVLGPSGARDETLLVAIADTQPDMLVMTTHARSGVPRLVMGSVATTIVRRSGVPTLLVYADIPAVSGSRHEVPSILVTLDGTPEAEAIVPAAMNLAQAMHCAVALLKIVVPFPSVVSFGQAGIYVDVAADRETAEALAEANAYLAAMRTRITATGLTCTAQAHIDADIAGAIEQYAQDTGVAMIAMATHARGRVGEMILGSVADGVLRHAKRPVLVCHSLVPVPVALATR